MVLTLGTVLLIIAFVFFILAAISVPSPPRLNWVAAGLAFWVLAILIGTLPVRG